MRKVAWTTLIIAVIWMSMRVWWDASPASIAAFEPARSFGGWVAFTAYREGNWDIYAIRADGTELRRLTADPAEDRSPAWSPDGKWLAFQSRRNGNWDIYLQSLVDATTRRLTVDPGYDSAPAWSPDGRQIAFDSYRAGDLDVMLMDVDSETRTNLTTTSSAGDFDPAWSPDGKQIAFTSWRMGDNDIFLMDVATREVTQLTDSDMPEGNASWSPDGKFLAYVQDQTDRREVFAVELGGTNGDVGGSNRLTWFSHDDSLAWSPDGSAIAYISHQHTNEDAEYLLVQDLVETGSAGPLFASPVLLLADWEIEGPLSWMGHDLSAGEVLVDFRPQSGSFSPGVVAPRDFGLTEPNVSDGVFTDLRDVEAPNARLNTKFVQAFETIRREVREESGYDFLSELSDMWRGPDAWTEGSAYLSWHKAGQAFDTLFDYRDAENHPLLEVVREDIGGETFWRIFLKAAAQDGSMGSPLKVHPWDLSGAARRKHSQAGGTWKAIPYGYYVDISRIIRHGGWERISSIDRRDFSWRWHFLAIEYWHHQVRQGLTWYQTMVGLYSENRAREYFDWRTLVREGEEPYNLFGNGLPIPPRYAQWKDVKP